jgi:hypothetical protein
VNETDATFKKVSNILFLDDMEERHRAFINRFGMNDSIRIWQVRTAKEAIDLIDRFENDGLESRFRQVFLDHDLSLEDIMCPPGGPSHVPTGMDVVDRLVKLPPECRPDETFVHSMNEPAAKVMVNKLGKVMPARWVPFHMLVA